MLKHKSKLVDKLEQDIREIIEEVKEKRDELELQIYLGRAESKDEWETAEKKWQELKSKAELLGKEVKSVSKDIDGVIRILARELKSTYTRIHQQLKQS